MKGRAPIDKLRAKLRTEYIDARGPWAHHQGKRMEPISEKQLTEWMALVDAATAGPWTDDGDAQSWNGESYAQSWVETAAGRWSQMEPETGAAMAQQSADSRFIAAARTAVPALIAEVRRLKAVALTFEDEADRVGLELKQAREEVARLRALEPLRGTDAWTNLDVDGKALAEARRAERERILKLVEEMRWEGDQLAVAIRALPEEP